MKIWWSLIDSTNLTRVQVTSVVRKVYHDSIQQIFCFHLVCEENNISRKKPIHLFLKHDDIPIKQEMTINFLRDLQLLTINKLILQYALDTLY